jgi:thiamine-phosphate pyrophosphorylase
MLPEVIGISPGTLDERSLAAFERRLGAAWAGGLRGVMLREPALTDRAYLELARRVREMVARGEGGWFAVHDRAHLALEVGADAVHVGWRSLRPGELRAWLPREIAIGLSTHADDDDASWAGADYLFHGPVFAIAKPHARVPVGIDGIARAVARTDRPVWALGGLAPEHASELVSAGARGMAVLSGLLARDDAGGRARAYVEAWRTATIRP